MCSAREINDTGGADGTANEPPEQPSSTAGQSAKRQCKRDDNRPGVWVGYGKLLKKFRKQASLTQEQLADRVGYSYELVSSIECGRRPAKPAFTTAAERELAADGVLEVLQEDVDFAKLPAFFQDFALIEGEAIARSDYDPLLVPGLLQTEEYARRVIEGHCPPLDDETIEDHVDGRLGRQRLLAKAPPIDFSFVIGEAALRNPVGDVATMRRQCHHLLQLSKQRNLGIQVMPEGRGFHPGLNGPLVVLETAEHKRFGYFESQDIGHFVSDPAEVSTFELRYGKLRSQALDVVKSAAFIEELAGEQCVNDELPTQQAVH